MTESTSEFQTLLQNARDGDDAALQELVNTYESELVRVTQARLGNALRPYLDSVDLVQSVHKTIFLGLRDDKFDIQSPRHLVRLAALIVRRKIARHWKRHRRQMRLDNKQAGACDDMSLASLVLSASGSSVDPTEQVDLNERLVRVMERLQPLDRRLIELRLEGYSTAADARQMDQDPDLLRARLGRVRRKLESTGVAADWI